MKALVIPIAEAQRLAEAIAALPLPYTASRPLMLILEQARVMEVAEPERSEPNGG